MTTAIRIEGLTKSYDGHRALSDLSLAIPPGEMFGFLGPNGAGKSTTIRLLLDLIRPDAGRAFILDHDCQAESLATRAKTGYLAGDLRLYSGLTGEQHVALVSGLRERVPDRRHIAALAQRLGLELSHRVGALSKGNRQKLGLVLALLDRPPVLILDEPTSGLDPLMQRVVWELLRDAVAEGATVFFSSHVLSEVEHTCQRVGILRAGKLVAVEPVAELLGRSLHRLEVTFAVPPPAAAFAIPGVQELRREGATVWLEARFGLDRLVKALAAFAIVDLRTEQPSLEEVLLTYYQQEAA